MSRASRDKGKRGELEVAHIAQRYGFDARRTPNSGGLHIPGDLDGVPGIHFEVKRHERLALPSWIAQAEAECPEGCVPVVAFRKSREPWRSVLPLEALFELLRGDE